MGAKNEVSPATKGKMVKGATGEKRNWGVQGVKKVGTGKRETVGLGKALRREWRRTRGKRGPGDLRNGISFPIRISALGESCDRAAEGKGIVDTQTDCLETILEE